MQEQTQPQIKKQHRKRYVREDLLLGSFILHAHADEDEKDYISCVCDEECQYILMNDLKKIQNNHICELDERQLYEESKNNGHPDSLIKPLLKQKIPFFDFLIEIYSNYMHLEIKHNVLAELAISIKFEDEKEKESFLESCEGNLNVLIYQDCGMEYKFTLFTSELFKKEFLSNQIFVQKTNNIIPIKKQQQIQKQKAKFIVSQNQWIVIFSWLLRNQTNLNYSFKYDQLIDTIRKNSNILQKKVGQIRKRSYTRIYDFSCFYKGFQ